MSKAIYDLGLHEVEVIKDIDNGNGNYLSIIAIRVPGGWVYQNERRIQKGDQIGVTSSSVFVPFSDEHKPKAEPNLSDPTVL